MEAMEEILMREIRETTRKRNFYLALFREFRGLFLTGLENFLQSQ